MDVILELAHVSKVFKRQGRPDLTAIDDITFQLYPGEILGIVGESGSGKSTIAKAITRLMDVTTGSIRAFGEDITNARGEALRRMYGNMQMVFQSPVGSFDPRRTLGQGIGESLRNQGLPRAEVRHRVADLLRQCGLTEEFAGRYPHEVSGGQCQRAAIARALANEPKILICDEATSALDVTVQAQIIELLQTLHRQRELSIIFICHNLALVQQFCSRVLVMSRGRIVEQGTPDEVIQNPKEEYTRNLIDSVL